MLHIELDSPQIIASIDYARDITNFLMGGPPQELANQPPPTQYPPLVYRINIVKPRLSLLADPERRDSDAIHVTLAQICITQQNTMTCVVSRLGMSLGSMSASNDGVRFLDDVDITASYDTHQDAGQARTMVELRTQPVIIRASPQDLQLIYSIYLKASAMSSNTKPEEGTDANDAVLAPPSKPNLDTRQEDAATLEITSEHAVAKIDTLQLVIIGDAHQLPLLDFRTKEFALTAKDWSSSIAIETEIESYINYFNLGNSHWEPLMDPWWFKFQTSTTAARVDSPPRQEMKIFSKKRLELNITASFIEAALVTYSLMSKEPSHSAATHHGAREPYIIQNRTGYGMRIWAQYEGGKGSEHNLDDGCDTPWRFEDWRIMRENVMSSSHDRLGLALKGTQWDPLASISVIREGDHVYALRPKTRSITHRLLCHVEIHDNVKVVTFRSTFQVQNDTAMPVEMIVVDEAGNRVRDTYHIAPGTACPVPIESAYDHLIRIRPNQGFGYTWCADAYHWKDLVKQPVRTIVCPDEREGEPATRLVAATLYDKDDRVVRYYPKITLRLRAPVEVENLLPYDIKYRVYLKEQEHTYSAFLRQGGRSPIHIVDPLDLLLLGIDILDDDAPPFKTSDYAIVNTDNPEDLPIENRLRIQDKDQLELNLRLHYFRYSMSGGAFKIQIYCPYVIINKTGLDFGIKSKPFIGSTKFVAGQGTYRDSERRKTPKPLLFAHASDDRRNRAVIRFGDSGWSKPVSLDAVGADQQLSVRSSSRDSQMLVGLGIAEGLGEYKLTKVVTLYPRFLVKNMSTCDLCLRERGSEDEIKVTQGTRISLGWFRNVKDPQLVFAFDAPLNKEWSTAIQIQNVGKTYVRMRDQTGPQRLLLIEILLQGPSIFIHLHADPGEWPIIVRNQSSVGICFGQTKKHDGGGAHDVVKLYQGPSGSSVEYTWDEPTSNTGRIRIGFAQSQSGSHYRDVGVFEIGTLKPLTRRKGGHEVKLAFDVLAERHTQIVCITNYAEDKNIWKQTTQQKAGPGERPARSDTYGSATEFEAASTEAPDTFTLSVSLEGIGISLIDNRLRELAYVSFRGIDATLLDSAAQSSYGLIIRWIQIDNQLDEAPYQTWLRPADLPANPKELETRPNLSVSLIHVKDNKHGVMYIKYASVLLQKMAIEADESSLYAVAAFSKVFTIASDDADKSCLTIEPTEIPEPQSVEGGADLYFEVLHLQPVVFVISFERQDGIDVSERTFDSRNPLFFAVNAVTMAIGSISDASLMLNEMRIDDARMSTNVLLDRLFQHYKSELFSKVFRILGSVDILGNPVGLFNNISSGVRDLFYEPYHGLVVHGGSDLGVSVARGAGRFVKGTATGIGESLSKISGSFGKGLSVVAMDEEWARERQRRQVRNRNKINGFAVGASAFMNGLASGVTGVALKPIQGASQDGVQGAAKGIGKGVIGLVAKPTVGLLDFFAGATGTLRNAATIFDATEQGRARLPRHIAHDGILRPYSAREAQGLEWLNTIDNGKFRNSKYVAHVELPNDEDHVCILTTKELLLARMNKLSRTWHVQLSDLKAISLEASGISMTLRDSNKAGPFIALSDNSTKVWFFQQVKNVVNDYNETRSRAGGGR